MKSRFLAHSILVVSLAFLLAIISTPYLAQRLLKKAQKLEAQYRWKAADVKFRQACKLNPLNAELFAETGDFMMRQSSSRKRGARTPWFEKARKFYNKAIARNGHYAYYHYLQGNANLQLGDVSSALSDFRKTIELDPYNLRNNYLVGYGLLTVWNELGGDAQEFCAERLRRVVQLDPFEDVEVYQYIMYYTGNFKLAMAVSVPSLRSSQRLYAFMAKNHLWQYRRACQMLIDKYRKKEDPEEYRREFVRKQAEIEAIKKSVDEDIPVGTSITADTWSGLSWDGKHKYSKGRIFWRGTTHAPIDLPQGRSVIGIQARGQDALGVWPYMIVSLDGEVIGELFVESVEWNKYSFVVNTEGGKKVLSVTYPNDGGNLQEGLDRNLYLGEANVSHGF